MVEAYYITAAELAEKGFENTPDELMSSKHMIYSSPATLDFNSPGAKGFGVKRAGLAIPGSVMLLVAPGCCGRNTALLNELGYNERFFYLLLDDTDIVTGRHLTKIPKACKEVCDSLDYTPTAVMICITCVDALLGTDMERVCRKCEEATSVPTLPAYMYALTREKRLPPMAGIRKSVYGLLKPQKRRGDRCNILGYFSHLHDSCELYNLLKSVGVSTQELSRCDTIERYHELSSANFNLVINPEARYAAQDMEKRLGIPFIEINRFYRIDKIRNQYRLLGQALGVQFEDGKFYDAAKKSAEDLAAKHGTVRFAVGECVNADSFELALALTEYGHKVSEIYGTVGERNFFYIKKLAELSPDTRIFTNLSPTMLNYERKTEIDVTIGVDAGYYHPDLPNVPFNDEEQPFGYEGVSLLAEQLSKALEKEGK
ncbi:nitrogenase component 1 [Ruminococcus albus]|uniref:Oxidoreductase, nitrogenase component 1 n=1 Tax=Ruminococcus albus 8 TaxID=246199 RepID=E9SAH2_RUMAL|nr:nitrogenase component 1 [Ruminococcus albus]EGC03541.1 oxidoreductase, nitrogenase component 1 [Ruminococcus albus 8]MCC3349807.1 nitrogenase component 1 [Ruminococcus albus 8]